MAEFKLVVFWELPDLGFSEVYILELPWKEIKHFHKVHGRWMGGEENTKVEEKILRELETLLKTTEPIFCSADSRLGKQRPTTLIGPSTIIVCGRLATAEDK